jgi:carbamoyltransferase
MWVLGLNTLHDASVALVRDGEIVVCIEEERLSRQKHHRGFPERAIREALAFAKIGFAEVDAVGFYWHPWHRLGRFAWHFARHLPRTLSYLRFQPELWGGFAGVGRRLRDEHGFRGKLRWVRHHVAHAYSAFCPSPFEEAAVLTVDGTGEWTTTAIFRGARDGLAARREIGYPHSVGKVYEALTQYLGFLPLCDEGKVMGLAPYGSPRFTDAFEKILHWNGDGMRVGEEFFQYWLGRDPKYAPALVDLLGPARTPESPIEKRHEDVAASLQRRTEEAMLVLAAEAAKVAPSRNLCLAGGVALNSVANGRVLRESDFEGLFVQPAAYDAGAALGAALAVSHRLLGRLPRPRFDHAYLGLECDEASCARALERLGVAFERVADAPERAAELIAGGKVVGWFQGRAEYGPRALGARSILADPRDPGMKDRLNDRVKHREGFRPYAPSVLEERAAEWFVGAYPSPFMLLVFPVREDKRALVPAITHVDGTARVQTISREASPRFHALVSAFERRTGVPLVLNTSLNRRGEPMAGRPEDAVKLFLETELDALFLGDLLAVKGRA